MHKTRHRLLALTFLVATLVASAARGQHPPPAGSDHDRPDPRELSVAGWRSDLRFLVEAIENRHPDPFHAVSRRDFAAAAEALDDRLGELSYPQILVELSRLVALLGPGDGHSRVQLDARFTSGQVPLRFWWFADGLWVRSAAPEHARLAGRKVAGLGGLEIDEALARVGAITAADNEMDRRLKVATYLVIPEILQGLGLAGAEGVTLDLGAAAAPGTAVDATTVERLEVPFRPWPEGVHASIMGLAHDPVRLGAGSDWVDMRSAEVPSPLYLSRPDDWYWMEEIAGGKVLYAQYNVVGNEEGEPSLADFFHDLFARAHGDGVDKLVLDVRLNGGGNNFFNRPFIHGLICSEKMNRRGRTYVLIGRNTFSAAQNLVTKLSQETSAVFVGEPTGGKPNHYGDARRVSLPASGLEVSISTLYWQDGGPLERRPWIPPDLAVDVTGEDYAAGRDPVLEAVLGADPEAVGRPFGRLLDDALAHGDLDGVMAAYRVYKNNPAHRYVDTERAVNRAGYALLGTGRAEAAVALFRLNVEDYPHSWNVHDSLGEGLAEMGRIEEAIDAYERSLELNPENAAGRRMLERLRALKP